MEEIKNLLNPLVMQEIAEIESKVGKKTQSKVLEMVTQAIKSEKKDSVEWFCCFSFYCDEEERITKQIMEIAIGPIWTGEFVPWFQKKIENRCKAKIQIRNFGNGNQVFFAEQIESSADIFLINSAIRRKLNEPNGEKAIKKEIEESVEKLSDAFKTFNGILNRMLI